MTQKPIIKDRDKKRYCPICGTLSALPIQYGYPTQIAIDRVKRGEIILGGCNLDSDSPQWMCTTCHHTWRTTGESKLWSEDQGDVHLPESTDVNDNTPP